jgi:multiple sugar transport system permease protein
VTHHPRAAIVERERRLGRRLVAPALTLLALVAAGPIAAAVWESLHHHDLRLPWLGRQFVGLSNYLDAMRDERFLR